MLETHRRFGSPKINKRNLRLVVRQTIRPDEQKISRPVSSQPPQCHWVRRRGAIWIEKSIHGLVWKGHWLSYQSIKLQGSYLRSSKHDESKLHSSSTCTPLQPEHKKLIISRVNHPIAFLTKFSNKFREYTRIAFDKAPISSIASHFDQSNCCPTMDTTIKRIRPNSISK